MLIAYIPLLFAIIGLLIYVLATNAKVVELGRIVFFAGFFVTMLAMATKVLRIGAG